MSNEELREALQIGLEWARSYCTRPADDHPDVRKIEAAIASLPTIKDCLTVAPTFNQAEHDTMVEKGTQAWADPADYPERCKVDPLQSLADQAQELNMGYDDVIDLAQAKRLITQLRARILELTKGETLRDAQQSKIRAEELSDDDIDEIWCAQSVAGLDPYQSIVEWNVQLRRRFARSLLSKVRQ